MDTNTTQEIPSQNPESSQQLEQSKLPKKSRLPLIMIVVCLLIIGVAIIGIIFYKQNNSQEQLGKVTLPTSANTKFTSQVNIPTTKSVTAATSSVTSTPTSTIVVLPTPEPSLIAGWKSFSDKSIGFSFKYPSDLIEGSNDPYSIPDGANYHFTSPDFSTEKGQGGSYIVKVLSGMQLNIMVQKADQYNPVPSGPADYFSHYKDVLVNNVKIHVSLNYNNLGRIAQADVIVYGKRYTIYLDSSQNEDTLFYQILSTFTFFNSQN